MYVGEAKKIFKNISFMILSFYLFINKTFEYTFVLFISNQSLLDEADQNSGRDYTKNSEDI